MSKLLISQYHAEIERIAQYGGTRKEMSVRNAFFKLLNAYCEPKHFLLIPELDYRTKFDTVVYPDGTVKDALRLDWGYWESKGQEHHLDAKIHEKLAAGYPNDNILFENSQLAVLIQRGQEVMRVPMRETEKLDRLLNQFINYERPDVKDFRQAIDTFKTDLPTILDTLREMIEAQGQTNSKFKQARNKLLKLCRETINPDVTVLDIREMMIQHILTEEIFLTVFNESQFHRENPIAKELQTVVDSFFSGTLKRNTLASIESYYAAIRREATRIHNHHEKQQFLKVVYENFYKNYNPKAADRLGVVYTPNEIVRFMIESADELVYKHFGKLLADPQVEILDPATGTGTFITELIEYLPHDKLSHKYRHEIHCNEVNILSYYIANLNIEYTYKQKMGEYVEFEHICFVDTLDNMGFGYSGQQQDLFGFVEENIKRIKEQNTRTISVIIGNPPYNANQKNENENNKNREYPEIDKLIKKTYIEHSTAQKTKLYDMYARFFRWASKRLSENGVLTFVTNNSFIDARTYDGFRKVVAEEFSEIYIVDLGGNIRKKESGNVFGITLGVAISFFVKRADYKGKCKIFYARPEVETATGKLGFLRTTPFEKIDFTHIIPDNHHNWIHLVDNDFDELVPVIDKQTKLTQHIQDEEAVFKLFSLGIVTNRDDWVYDFSKQMLCKKMKFFFSQYHSERIKNKDRKFSDDELSRNLKWTRDLKKSIRKGIELNFENERIIPCHYRPFVKRFLYYDRYVNEMRYQMPIIFPDDKSTNMAIFFNDRGSRSPFSVLAIDTVGELHFCASTDGFQCLPLYRYDEQGNRLENITDWGLQQFREHYKDLPGFGKPGRSLDKLDIFHYTYAVLHNPAYRETYELNLKREFPRLPFYDDFWQWAEWGKALMELHLNYESAEPYPLERRDIPECKNEIFATEVSLPDSKTKVSLLHSKPKLKADKLKNAIILDTVTSLHSVPPLAWEYKLGNRSALEWILDQYKEKKPRDPTIREKFNTYRFADYKKQVIDLLLRVCTVSVKTMEIIRQMEDVFAE